MSPLSTFFDRLFFATVCVVSWVIFPILIAVGGTALFAYALIAELCSCTTAESAAARSPERPAARTTRRIYETLQP
ncbi:MAG: hypothetical protein ABSC32_10985 [Steroidobacteraceae bacterium]|jgi:hypothetical protein